MKLSWENKVNDWYRWFDGFRLQESTKGPDEKQKFVRRIVISWLGNRILPEKKDFDVFGKSIYLFNKDNLLPLLKEYRESIFNKEKHWLEYIHTLSSEFFFSFAESEMNDMVCKYDIGGREFVQRMQCVSGLISHISSDIHDSFILKNRTIDDKWLMSELSIIGNHCADIYERPTNEILSDTTIIGRCNDKEKFKEEIIKYLEDTEIPLEFGHPLPGKPFEVSDEQQKIYRKRNKLHWEKRIKCFTTVNR